MDRRITIGVVVLFALLGGYIWYTFLRQDAPPVTPQTPEPTAILFLNFEFDKAQTLQVRDVKNNQTTRVVRDGDKWKMEQPAQGEAFLSRVDDLVFNLARVTATRKLNPQADLAQFGLNPAQYETIVTLQDGTTFTILLGNENPEGSAFYASKNGDAGVYLIDTSVGETIREFVTMPPYTPTPTATPGPTETPAAAPNATPTP